MYDETISGSHVKCSFPPLSHFSATLAAIGYFERFNNQPLGSGGLKVRELGKVRGWRSRTGRINLVRKVTITEVP